MTILFQRWHFGGACVCTSRGQRMAWLPCSVFLYLIPLRQGLSWNLEQGWHLQSYIWCPDPLTPWPHPYTYTQLALLACTASHVGSGNSDPAFGHWAISPATGQSCKEVIFAFVIFKPKKEYIGIKTNKQKQNPLFQVNSNISAQSNILKLWWYSTMKFCSL